MSESSTHETNVEGGVSGPVQSGSFQGPVQTVHVNIPAPPPPPDTATHGERIRFITAAIMNLQQMFVEYTTNDGRDRRERQTIADERYQEAKEHRETVNAQLDGQTIKLDEMSDDILDLKHRNQQVVQDIQEVVKRVERVEVQVNRSAWIGPIVMVIVFLLIASIAFWLVTR